MSDIAAPGRVLGVDFGGARIGVAVSEGGLAVPVGIVEHTNRADDLDRVAAIAREQGVRVIVVGLPLLMSGEEGEQARHSRRFGDALARRAGVPVVYHDERLSSVEAEHGGRDLGSKPGGKRRLDDVAATMILQSYIDAQGAAAGECEALRIAAEAASDAQSAAVDEVDATRRVRIAAEAESDVQGAAASERGAREG